MNGHGRAQEPDWGAEDRTLEESSRLGLVIGGVKGIANAPPWAVTAGDAGAGRGAEGKSRRLVAAQYGAANWWVVPAPRGRGWRGSSNSAVGEFLICRGGFPPHGRQAVWGGTSLPRTHPKAVSRRRWAAAIPAPQRAGNRGEPEGPPTTEVFIAWPRFGLACRRTVPAKPQFTARPRCRPSRSPQRGLDRGCPTPALAGLG